MRQISRRTFVKTVSVGVASANLVPMGWGDHRVSDHSSDDLTLWFDKPAAEWTDALPIGNGRLGAMVFGGDVRGDASGELLQLNDSTLWSGKPRDGNNSHAKDYLPAVRSAVLEQKDYHLADELCRKMQGKHTEAYQPLANLRLKFDHEAPIEQYRRELDLDTGCAHVQYMAGGIRFEREMFSSLPDQVLILHLKASAAHRLSCTISLDAELGKAIEAAGDTIFLTGKVPSHITARNHPGGDHPILFSDLPGEGMNFTAVARAVIEGGSMTARDGSLEIRQATAITVFLSSATGYKGFQHLPDTPPTQLRTAALRLVDVASKKQYGTLRQSHIADHQSLFRRVSLSLGVSASSRLPTDQRLAAFAETPDPALLALYFQYGRYLLIACSRPGSQPANLQGMWNDQTLPPWGSNWTSNINIQMNYWPAETCNLSDCASPLFDFIRDLSVNGAQTASESYGMPGWCAHHNIDLWRSSNAAGEGVGAPTWGNWCMAGPWLCSHLYEHYRFTHDITFLREQAYPLMRSAAEFCFAWLIEDGHGNLTTCPSESTENDFLAPDGKPAMTSAGCTMDMALIRELFTNCISSAEALNIDQEFSAKLASAIKRLLPYRIGSHGQLQEWSIDFAENTPGQRHMSHLYPLFPGSQITPRDTPDLAEAARISLERRLAAGGAYTGWSRAWAINFWARLYDGDKAWESLVMLMRHSTNRNLFDTHPAQPSQIFQIDGNFGATASIAEMLLQSHTSTLDLLPALPSAWPSGTVKGLQARGAVTVGMAWSRGRLVSCTLLARRGQIVNLRPPKDQLAQAISYGTTSFVHPVQDDGVVKVLLRPEVTYSITFA